MQKQVLNELSKQILAGKVTKDSHIVLDEFDHQLVNHDVDTCAEQLVALVRTLP